jgi:uncharacterized protein (DUF697 family)
LTNHWNSARDKDPQMAKEPTGSGKTEKSGEVTAKAGPETEATDESRDEIASKLVDRFALWAGGAGLIPIPLVDMATVAGVQIQMLRRLSQIYGVPFSDNRGKSLIAGLLGSTIPATSGLGMAGVLKMVPLVGTALGSLMMPALAAGATYAIGRVFIQHFASGGTLLDFHPPDYREFFKAQKEKWTRRSASAPAAGSSPSSSSKGTATAST